LQLLAVVLLHMSACASDERKIRMEMLCSELKPCAGRPASLEIDQVNLPEKNWVPMCKDLLRSEHLQRCPCASSLNLPFLPFEGLFGGEDFGPGRAGKMRAQFVPGRNTERG
jgi:hypothetical protein